jgi:hypothetical protein
MRFCSNQYPVFSSFPKSHHKPFSIASTLFLLGCNFKNISAFSHDQGVVRDTHLCNSQKDNIDNIMDSSRDIKTAQELKIQWAGGRDVWPKVPVDEGFMSIQTKVRDPTLNASAADRGRDWPTIVKESTMYGFGAYNPRGQVLSNDVNVEQHNLLQNDIEYSMANYPGSVAQYWEAASIWEDGSSEKGFILAFREKKDEGLALSIDLARRYNQGAIYRFKMEDDRLMRDTIAVLDDGTEARVEVVMDELVDLSPFF